MRKRVLLLLVCGILAAAGIYGCGSAPKNDEIEVTNTPEPTVAPTATPTPEIADISSVELVADMNIGWSLGNTLDAIGGIGIMSETSWGNPKTTQEMIDAVLDAGFNVIRIPVTWEGHFGPAPEYKIHDIWMQRVKEVVDYAYKKGAYVILNTHHEEWYIPDEANKEAHGEQIAVLWTQIANYFKDYDEHLIFEGLNEPRKRETPVEWSGDEEAREVINHWQQIFVDTVRATGGNNELRHLMISGYAASSSRTNLSAIKLPSDDKLIVSVHAYIPYNFVMNKEGTNSWSTEDAGDIDNLMENLEELFISKGIPVIIGEFGAVNKDNEQERVEWITYYLTKAKEIGVPCIWWDNQCFETSGENYGLLNRRTLEFAYPKLLQAMMQVANP